MKKIALTVLQIIICCSVLIMNAQHQLGVDINGEAAGDQSGNSISINSNGTIVAIGAPKNDGNGSNSGHVRVYQETFETWNQIGGDIDGEAADDLSGTSVSLSSDGTILAIGATGNDGGGSNSGHVRVYKYASGSWTQLGGDIDGEAAGDQSGTSVSLNSDGTILAIGAIGNDASINNEGHVRVYQYSSGTDTWNQLGGDIDGETLIDSSGTSVSLNSDGTILAIGATGNDGGGSSSGHVRVYQYISSSWTQLGGDIDGEAADDQSGTSVSLNSDGTILAIGAIGNDGGGSSSGHVRVYQYISSSWTQLGGDIDGERTNDLLGTSVSLSSDGTILAAGAPDFNGTGAGYARVYQNIYGTWRQIGQDIEGNTSIDNLGRSVSLSSDGTDLAIGSYFSNANGQESGHASMYITMNKWLGTTDNDWGSIGNWEVIMVPGINDHVFIPKGASNYPTLTFPITVNTIVVNSGASFISTSNFVTANIMYRRELPTTNWYLTSAPVTGLDIDDFVNNAGLAKGTGNNIALGSYDNSIPGWSYYQDGTATAETFTPGVGYAVKKTTSGTLDYVGAMNTGDVTLAITRNANGFNLIGNPYPSYIAGNTGAANILENNTSILEETTLWLWNQATNSYDQKNLASPAFKIAPGQAFFVEAKTGGGDLDITEAMQSHETTDTFQKGRTTSRPEINIVATNDTDSKSIDVYYINSTTTGFDNGYDSSIFGGVSSDFLVYTGLVSGGGNDNLGIQSLPDSGYEDMVIPIGLKTNEGDIDFEIDAVNFPTGIDVYLEDRETNTFTKVEDTILRITLDNSIDGIGRFYIHTTSEALSTDNVNALKGIHIFSSSDHSINITGIKDKSTVKVFSITGKEIANKDLTITTNQSITLPNVAKGIYLVQLTTSTGTINKKVVLK